MEEKRKYLDGFSQLLSLNNNFPGFTLCVGRRIHAGVLPADCACTGTFQPQEIIFRSEFTLYMHLSEVDTDTWLR